VTRIGRHQQTLYSLLIVSLATVLSIAFCVSDALAQESVIDSREGIKDSPTIAVSKGGVVYVAYEDDNVIRVARLNGTRWERLKKISVQGKDLEDPSITSSPNQSNKRKRIHISYNSKDGSVYVSSYAISIDRWSRKKVNSYRGEGKSSDIDIHNLKGANYDLYVSWIDKDPRNNDIQMALSKGEKLSDCPFFCEENFSRKEIYQGSGIVGNIDLDIGDNQLYIALKEEDDKFVSSIQCNAKEGGNFCLDKNSWSKEKVKESDFDFESTKAPSIATDPSGNVVLTFQAKPAEKEPLVQGIRFSTKKRNGEWSKPKSIDNIDEHDGISELKHPFIDYVPRKGKFVHSYFGKITGSDRRTTGEEGKVFVDRSSNTSLGSGISIEDESVPSISPVNISNDGGLVAVIEDVSSAILFDGNAGQRVRTQKVDVYSGWNIISSPFRMTNTMGEAVPDVCNTGTLYSYSPRDEEYIEIGKEDRLQPGQGTWIRCDNRNQITIKGVPPSDKITGIYETWNMKGPLDSKEAQLSSRSNVVSAVYAFDTNENKYIEPPRVGSENEYILQPGMGYWVSADSRDVITTIPPQNNRNTLSKQTSSTLQEKFDLFVSDTTGSSATLSFVDANGVGATEVTQRPPSPPAVTGAFDARFSNGRRYVVFPGLNVNGASSNAELKYDVRISGASGVVTLRLRTNRSHNNETTVRPSLHITDDATDGKRLTATLSRGSPSTLVPEDVERLKVTVGTNSEAASQTSLKAVQPNPASTNASIRYELSEQAKVSLKVFDVLGRRVATLVDNAKQAGQHQVRLDATDLPSGTYFVRMRADNFQKSRRLTVVH